MTFQILEKARGRIEELEAVVVHQRASINSVLCVLADVTGQPREKVEAAFKHYEALSHQKFLERIEDTDPAQAARLDLRKQAPED